VLRPWLILALVCGGFSLDPRFLHTFWTRDYLPSILQQAATNIILAVGLTFVILTGGIDLSVGSVMALCGVALGLMVKSGPPPFLADLISVPAGAVCMILVARTCFRHHLSRGQAWASSTIAGLFVTWLCGAGIVRATSGGVQLEGAILAALGTGVSCGLVNGLLVSIGRVPSFVATLGMLTAARGLTLYATGGNSVSGLPPRLGVLGEGMGLVVVALGAVAAGTVFHLRTRAGRIVQAIGANEEAARLAGLNVSLYKTLAYMISGLCAALAAIVLTAKFQLADTGAGAGAELNAIAAVVIGGTSLSGGRGSVIGSLVGALTIAVLNAGLVLINVMDTLQGVIIGAVIVVAVMVDRIRVTGS
jgi:ribose/xylose/arabinose/galactoside ABC-type transport system permease subunit